MKKQSSKPRNLSVYSNLAKKRKAKKDAFLRQKAEYLASLPKHPLKRTLYRMHPKRVAAFWFSKRGALLAAKIFGIGFIALLVTIGGVYAYFRKDLDSIRPGELAKRVQTTVTRYEDRNGVLLWEDKGQNDYTLVVDGKDISDYVKKATIAIEDKDFYKHKGISISGIIRSALNNANGGYVQGGSTLTQQLVKQVFFDPTEAQKRGLNGVPRKIKEIILSTEVERMYNKDQILDLYLNESPYGGRRNGVESGARTYFGKAAKDLTLPEAALLASIPNQPWLYNPYNVAGHTALITRQHKVLDNMVELSYITKAQADGAKAYPILDHIIQLSEQFDDIKAPHFVLMVKSQLEAELGQATVGRGGLTIRTSLDSRIQNKLEESMTAMFNSSIPAYAGFTNGASVVEDVKTGQVVALLGSRDFHYEGFGQDNATQAYIQPGSTIKPLVYAQLFTDQGADKVNYGSGSILADDSSMASIYGAKLNNADGKFLGSVNIRKSLALSRNVPAVKAMYISGVQPTLGTIRALGDTHYCTQGSDAQAGLASSIGGCGAKMIEHVNAFASLARLGTYKPYSTVLEVKNSQGEIIKQFKDESKQIVDPQVAYILADILSDDIARAGLYGPRFYGLYIPGVKTAAKTGTSDKDGNPKDIWTLSYSPVLSMGVWLGNPDTSVLKNGNSSLPAKIIGQVMEYAHKDIYTAEGKWKSGDWYAQPAGIQNINGELFPSWYSKNKSQTNAKMTFDKVSKKKATACTPELAKIELDVTTILDPITKKNITKAPDGYDANSEDDAHNCNDVKPRVLSITTPSKSGNTYEIAINVEAGDKALTSVEVKVSGNSIVTIPVSGSGTYKTSYTFTDGSTQRISATVVDSSFYTDTAEIALTPSS